MTNAVLIWAVSIQYLMYEYKLVKQLKGILTFKDFVHFEVHNLKTIITVFT